MNHGRSQILQHTLLLRLRHTTSRGSKAQTPSTVTFSQEICQVTAIRACHTSSNLSTMPSKPAFLLVTHLVANTTTSACIGDGASASRTCKQHDSPEPEVLSCLENLGPRGTESLSQSDVSAAHTTTQANQSRTQTSMPRFSMLLLPLLAIFETRRGPSRKLPPQCADVGHSDAFFFRIGPELSSSGTPMAQRATTSAAAVVRQSASVGQDQRSSSAAAHSYTPPTRHEAGQTARRLERCWRTTQVRGSRGDCVSRRRASPEPRKPGKPGSKQVVSGTRGFHGRVTASWS